MDLNGYGVRELVELRQRIDNEIRTRHQQNPEHTESELHRAAERWGLALTEVLMGVGDEADRHARRVRYQHPFDPHVAWSGMGPKPGWVKDWEEAGNSMESLRIREQL